ncbi:hypothetical protein NM688_g1 [Phlebia brevispora]|uniref:Uncharacterized protein n=1 Tax=Phlebia brevispora TaxID=194682 RepID=A0ACC1TF78_9APHY|nr:hypothetical protein NM688_g1 [Phlebia brevispora]
MATPYAFVTLVTSDSYLPGALALVAALDELHPAPPISPEVGFQTVCLVTPETVDVSSIKLLRRAFNVVVGVEVIEQEDDKNLRLLGRLDLNTVLTKLHIFRLTQYSKIIFLDADVLPIRPLSHLFTLPHEFSAVPDVGWPDIFNSGVLVLAPGEDKFNELMELQKTKGSWDGGDQGLLNEWRGENWNRLSFIYNTTPTAAYTYAPAYERFGSKISAIHFIGENKPWKSLPWRAPGTKSSQVTMDNGDKRVYNYEALVDRWNLRSRDILPFGTKAVRSERRLRLQVQRRLALGTALGLDELRKVAIEGLAALGSTEPVVVKPAEGEYRSMPLEGRIDLMRPPKEPESHPRTCSTPRPTHVQMPEDNQGYFRTDTFPTPGPNEVPPAPYLHGHSLPPTETPTPYYGPPFQQQGLFEEPYRSSHHIPSESQPQPYYPYVPPTPSEQRHGHHWESSTQETPGAPASGAPSYGQHVDRGGHEVQTSSWEAQQQQWEQGSRTEDRYHDHPGHHHHERGSQSWQQQHAGGQGQQAASQQYYEEQQSQYGGYSGQRQYGGHGHHHRGSAYNDAPQMAPQTRHDESYAGQGRPQQHHHAHYHPEGGDRHHRHHHEHQELPPPMPVARVPPPRPISPPKMEWNPAKEPPPKTPPAMFTFPEDTRPIGQVVRMSSSIHRHRPSSQKNSFVRDSTRMS